MHEEEWNRGEFLRKNLCLFSGPDKTELSIKGRINVYKTIGTRYIKVTYKEFSDEVLVISVVDKS